MKIRTLLTAILCQVLLGAVVIHGEVQAAHPAPATTENEQVIATLRRAHELRQHDSEGFLTALQSVAALLPEVPVGTTYGESNLVTFRMNAHGQGLDAIRFRTPEGERRDMVWCFYLPADIKLTWYIAPTKGKMD